MAPLSLLPGAVALALAMPLRAQSVERWRPLVVEASQRFGLPEAWIGRVIRAESGGATMLGGRPIRSRAGAIGLMQLMPGTWAAMRSALGLGADPDDPHDNILAGSFYLRLMYDRFGYPGLFAAYNAGPVRYAAHLAAGQPLPAETVAYLAKLGGPAPAPAGVAAAEPPPPLFAVGPEAHPQGASTARLAALFAVRHDAR